MLTQAGYLGLGISNPIGRLHIINDNAVGGGDDDYLIDEYTTTGAGDQSFYLRKGRGTATTPQNLQAGDLIGRYHFTSALPLPMTEKLNPDKQRYGACRLPIALREKGHVVRRQRLLTAMRRRNLRAL